MLLRASDGIRGLVINQDTGNPIRKVIWANLQTGDFEAFRTDAEGRIIADDFGRHLKYRGKCRLKFIPAKTLSSSSKQEEEQLPLHPKVTQKIKKITVPLFDLPCDYKGCHRIAEWMVSDEVELPPIKNNGRLYSRARTVDRRVYCSWHYKPPRLLDHKGEMIKEYENVVRPD